MKITFVVVIAVAAGVVFASLGRAPIATPEGSTPSRAQHSSVNELSVPIPKPARSPDEQVRKLLSEPSLDSDAALLESYFAWARSDSAQTARRRILENWSGREDARFALLSVVRAISGDGVPAEVDPHWEFAQSALKRFWEERELFTYGRDRLLSTRNDKEQRLLATSLLEFASTDESIDEQSRLGLASDAIDLYYRSEDPILRSEILSRLEAVAGAEVTATLRAPNEVDEP